MRKSILLCFCIMLLVFSACKKHETSPDITTTRVGSVYDDSSKLSTTYYYSLSFLISGFFDDSGKYYYYFHYNNDQTIEQVDLNGGGGYSVIYFWNTQGYADSSAMLNAGPATLVNKKYTYDNNNFLTSVKWYNEQNAVVLIENFTISNNNITQHSYNIIDSTGLTLPRGSYSYTYYTNLSNTLSNIYFGQPYLGNSSQNPVKSSTYTNGSNTSSLNYTYTYGQGGIVTEQIYTDSSGANGARIDSLSFSYYIQ